MSEFIKKFLALTVLLLVIFGLISYFIFKVSLIMIVARIISIVFVLSIIRAIIINVV